MTGLDLDALEAVARAATPGPWNYRQTVLGMVSTTVSAGDGSHVAYPSVCHALPENATHIATFDPPTVLTLIARVKRAEARMPCDGGCNYNDGPEETCSAHGRTPAQIWEVVDALCAERDAAEARLREAEAVIARIEQLCAETDVDTTEATQAWLVENIGAVLASYKSTNDENGGE